MEQDKHRWNKRYRTGSWGIPQPDDFLVLNSQLLTGGSALDLACGLGGNSIFLALNNYWVDAVDVSEYALRDIQRRAHDLGLDLGLVVSDLDYFPIPHNHYDLVLVFYFFSQNIIPGIIKALRSGGLIIYCTYNYRHLSLRPDFKAEYLVPSGGLAPFFSGMRILVDEPEAGDTGNLSRIVVQRVDDRSV